MLERSVNKSIVSAKSQKSLKSRKSSYSRSKSSNARSGKRGFKKQTVSSQNKMTMKHLIKKHDDSNQSIGRSERDGKSSVSKVSRKRSIKSKR